MKNYSNEIKEALANNNPITDLIVLHLTTGNIYLTTAGHDISWNGNSYQSSSIVLGTDDIKQQQELRVGQMGVQITAVDQSILALFQNANQQNRRFTLIRVILDDVHQVIGELLNISYYISSYGVDDTEEQTIVNVTLTNSNGNYESVKGIRTTQASFQKFYPNSTSFINSKDTRKELKWGGK